MKFFNKYPTNPTVTYGNPSDDSASIYRNSDGSLALNLQFTGAIPTVKGWVDLLVTELTSFSNLVTDLDVGTIYLGLMVRNFITDDGIRYVRFDSTKYGGNAPTITYFLRQDKVGGLTEVDPGGGTEIDRVEVRCKASGLTVNPSSGITKVSKPFLIIGDRRLSLARQSMGAERTISLVDVDAGTYTTEDAPVTIMSNPGRGLWDQVLADTKYCKAMVNEAVNSFVAR